MECTSGSIYFLSRDPDVATTREPYAYVGGNPLNATDPLGLWGLPDLNPVDWAKAGVGAVGKAATKAWNATGGKAVNWVQHNLCFTPGNSKCEPLAPTVGFCVSAGIYGGIGYSGSACIVVSGGFKHAAITLTGGAGIGVGGGISAGPMVANAENPCDLAGPFVCGGGGYGLLGGDTQFGQGQHGNLVGQGMLGFGPSAYGYMSANRTTVIPLGSR